MTEQRVPGEGGRTVAVGPVPDGDAAPDDVLPAVVEERTDGSRRYIAYSPVVEGASVEDHWFSVDLDTVASRELQR